MSEHPLVSIITGTYPPRVEDAIELMRHVREQDYPNLEHCIAVEGDPDEVEATVLRLQLEARALSRGVRTRVVGLGRWWSSFLAGSISTAPFLVSQLLARGPLQMWLADDERMASDHIASLVDLLDATDSDFVYSYVRLIPGPGVPLIPHAIGSYPPMLGQITNALYRVELLDYRMFAFGVGAATDWDQVSHWLSAGARCAMLDRVTLEHRIDKLGEGPDFRPDRQPLRGQMERASA